MSKTIAARYFKLSALLAVVGVLGACTSIGYRCPLKPGSSPDDPTACASMQDALAGAKRGTGGKASVLMDDKGRLIPRELLSGKPVQPLALQGGEPYRDKSGNPVFVQPKVYQVWAAAFVDSEGNLHDGHHAWFSTPGRWAYGNVDRSTAVGEGLMAPTRPNDQPEGRLVTINPVTGAAVATQSGQPTAPISAAAQARAVSTASGSSNAMTTKEREQAALQNLSGAANNAASAAAQANRRIQQQGQAGYGLSPGVTAPAVKLGS